MSDNSGVQEVRAKRIGIRKAFTTPVTLDYAIPGLLMKSIGVIVAPGGTGKSMLTFGIASAVALGYDKFSIFGNGDDGLPLPVTKGGVVIVNVEDTEELMEYRLHELGRSFHQESEIDTMEENLDVISAVGMGFTLAVKGEHGRVEPSPRLETTIKNMRKRGPRLVIWDTLNRLSAGLDENSNGDMGSLMSIVEMFNRAVGCASLIIHHTSKAATWNEATDLQQAGRGASAVTDNARWQANLSPLGPKEAVARGINDDLVRREWVKMEVSKINAGRPVPMRWLKREEGGVLRGMDAGPGREPNIDTGDEVFDPTQIGGSKKKKGRG